MQIAHPIISPGDKSEDGNVLEKTQARTPSTSFVIDSNKCKIETNIADRSY